MVQGRRFPEDSTGYSTESVGKRQPIEEIDLHQGITSQVETLLRDICRRSRREAGLTSQDQNIDEARMNDYRAFFDDKFDFTSYVHDPRVIGVMRVLNFCYKVCFELEKFFPRDFYLKKTQEEVIQTFRQLFRMTLVELAENQQLLPYLLPAKIPLIKGGNPHLVEASKDLAGKIEQQASHSPQHVQAAIVLLLRAVRGF